MSPDDVNQILHFHQSQKMILQLQLPFEPEAARYRLRICANRRVACDVFLKEKIFAV